MSQRDEHDKGVTCCRGRGWCGTCVTWAADGGAIWPDRVAGDRLRSAPIPTRVPRCRCVTPDTAWVDTGVATRLSTSCSAAGGLSLAPWFRRAAAGEHFRLPATTYPVMLWRA